MRICFWACQSRSLVTWAIAVAVILPLSLASTKDVDASETGLYAGVAAGLSSTRLDRQQAERDLNEVGALVRLSVRLSLRAEWERAMNVGDENKTGNADFNVFALGSQQAFQ